MSQTHSDVIQELADGWGLPFSLVRTISPTRGVYQDLHPLAIMAGKEPERIGEKCGMCNGTLQENVCDSFRSLLEGHFNREIIDEYRVLKCPQCDSPIESREMVEEMVDMPDPVVDMSEPTPSKEETQAKTRYDPCGCLFSMGEEKIKQGIDRERLDADIKKGRFSAYGGTTSELRG